MSTKEELLACSLSREKVELGEGKSILVRGFTAGEAEMLKGASDSKFFAFSVINDAGQRIFDPGDPADIAAIDRMPAAVVRAGVEATLRLSGFRVNDTAKN